MADQLPVPDELAATRDKIKALQTRESELRALLLANPDLREGAAYYAEIKIAKQMRTDLHELRANHPEIVEQYTFPTSVTSVVLFSISEDGELTRKRSIAQ